MKAKSCDRCGALYKEYGLHDGEIVTAIKLLNEHSNSQYYGVSGPRCIYDLCLDCRIELIEWLKGKD